MGNPARPRNYLKKNTKRTSTFRANALLAFRRSAFARDFQRCFCILQGSLMLCYVMLFYFILFYFILFYFILFYFILFYFILFYFILFSFAN